VSSGVFHRTLGVGAAARGRPLMPARAGLGDFPPFVLLDLVATAAARAGVAAARPAPDAAAVPGEPETASMVQIRALTDLITKCLFVSCNRR
jgi:hypothetical protein